jgi:predicted ATPase
MITKVTVEYFKLFERQEFELSDPIILAGPNNSGKTTLLQAIAVWQFGLQRWVAERDASSKAKKRTGVPVTRKDFTAIPLRDMKLLWTNTSFSLKKGETDEGKPGYPRVIKIGLKGVTRGEAWELALEFRHQSSEQIYVKPSPEHLDNLPKAVKNFTAVHIPPFSGIGSEETRYDRPYQDLLIGQGRAGDILRNLLLEVYQRNEQSDWHVLSRQIEEIFGYGMQPPEYEGKPFIVCDYLRGVPSSKGKNSLPQLDIASAGSGFHQVLLLLGFFYARPASVLLLDEPDAHLHIVLQKQIYERLRSIAAERACQLIIATHSEVLIDGTSPELILSFYREPHKLLSNTERDQVREALKRLTVSELLLAERSKRILYVEGETDFGLLSAWARVLDHPLKAWFSNTPFWHSNQGRNPKESRAHFFALKAVQAKIKGFLLLDGDNRDLEEREVSAEGLRIGRWTRYESESYLLHPDALIRFIAERVGQLFAEPAKDYLKDQLPPAFFRDPLGEHDFLRSMPASKSLLPGLFKAAQFQLTKQDYYLIAEQMSPDEVHPEVRKKLDAIQEAFRA